MNLRKNNLDLLLCQTVMSASLVVNGFGLWTAPSVVGVLILALNLVATYLNVKILYLRCRYPSTQEEICQKK